VIFDIAIACVSAGGLMIAFAFFASVRGPQAQIETAVKELTPTVKTAAAGQSEQGAPLEAAQQQAASAIVKDYLDGLSGLADKLSKLTPAVSALVLSTVLFGLGAGLAAIDYFK
jgi:hypothetical protein